MPQDRTEESRARWRHRISSAALTPDLLPPPAASWHETVHFAGTFDGYQTQVGVPNASAALESAREQFDATGTLEHRGLTELRALLFFMQRADYLGGGFGWEGRDLRFIYALVEAIREQVATRKARHVAGRDFMLASVGEIEDRLMDAFDRLVLAYARWGGHRFHGWTTATDPRNYLGPVIRSEGDCALRFAMELEREWPEAVHAEFPVSSANFTSYDPSAERRQRIDLAVTDLRGFVEDENSQERFRSHRHEVFVEVKWLTKGWRGGRFEMDARKRVASVGADAQKLANHLKLGRCAVAAALIVDDEDYFAENCESLEWPADVWRLVLGPETLRGLALNDEL